MPQNAPRPCRNIPNGTASKRPERGGYRPSPSATTGRCLMSELIATERSKVPHDCILRRTKLHAFSSASGLALDGSSMAAWSMSRLRAQATFCSLQRRAALGRSTGPRARGGSAGYAGALDGLKKVWPHSRYRYCPGPARAAAARRGRQRLLGRGGAHPRATDRFTPSPIGGRLPGCLAGSPRPVRVGRASGAGTSATTNWLHRPGA